MSVRVLGAFAIVSLVVGADLTIFADSAWALPYGQILPDRADPGYAFLPRSLGNRHRGARLGAKTWGRTTTMMSTRAVSSCHESRF